MRTFVSDHFSYHDQHARIFIDDGCTAFYEKCGFKKKENEMAKYASESPTPGKL